MSDWATKRFWTTVSVVEDPDGFAVRLDDREIRTPAKRALIVPSREFAEHVAAEWDAQVESIQPLTMPWTRSANAALDKVAPQRSEVMEHLIGYAGSDLLCYRAEGPAALVARQNDIWNPILDWLADTFDVRLATTKGVMPIEQPAQSIARLAEPMRDMSNFELAGFHDMVGLSGSYAIALAAARKQFPVPDLWAASRLDENWQIEQWGEDFEAKQDAEQKMGGFVHATELFSIAGKSALKC
jgi:chaperone required for assembly of F1-ATPase